MSTGYGKGVTNEGQWNPDGLIAGDAALLTGIKGTISSGESASETVRGAVLGRTSGGEYRVSASGNGDGSETPDCVLAHDVDASSGAVEASLYKTGHFNRNKMSAGSGIDLSDNGVIEGLRAKGITMQNAQAAPTS